MVGRVPENSGIMHTANRAGWIDGMRLGLHCVCRRHLLLFRPQVFAKADPGNSAACPNPWTPGARDRNSGGIAPSLRRHLSCNHHKNAAFAT